MKINKIRGLIREKFGTQAYFARGLGISSRALTMKLKRGIFTSDEMSRMIDLLEIEDPANIFFEIEATKKAKERGKV